MTHTPVLPERDVLGLIRFTAKNQATDMILGKSCPGCGCGIIPYGEVLCARCDAEEDRARIAREVATVRAALVEDEIRTLGRLHGWRRG